MTVLPSPEIVPTRSTAAFSFGPFVLSVEGRSLHRDGERLRLGGRATDILIALCNRAGGIVSKEDLLTEVWGNQAVDEGSLRVHISELRKVLGDGGSRAIVNVPGQGYSFVSAFNHTRDEQHGHTVGNSETELVSAKYSNPPLMLTRAIGRDEDVARIVLELRSSRFVSIVGTGGVGKTTVALAVADTLRYEFGQHIVFVDLALVDGEESVQAAFATAIGLPVHAEQDLASITTRVASERILWIVDNCEHVVAEAARVVQQIHWQARESYILTTAREPLHIAGERVHRLPPLATPDDADQLEEVCKAPAVELFVERAKALDSGFGLTDQNFEAVSNICRSLDGLALAIEFAASRVTMLGPDALAGHLGKQLDFLAKGRRTASPRHQTLRLTLDWSYSLLEDDERTVFQRLGVFSGWFSLTAAQAILGIFAGGPGQIANCLADLVDKSLITADTSVDPMRFRLFNTTREFALERLTEHGEARALAVAHARFFLDLLRDQAAREPNEPLTTLKPDLENIRRALAWSFSDDGDVEIGIPLAAAASSFFWDLALLTECNRWSSKALERLPDGRRGTREELDLMVNSSLSRVFTQGTFPAVRDEIGKTLLLAKTLREHDVKERVISGLFAFHLREGNVPGMIQKAEDAVALAKRAGLPFSSASDSLIATAKTFAGEMEEAIPFAERALSRLPLKRPIALLRTGVDQRMWAGNCLAQMLWIRGEFDRSRVLAEDLITEARETKHPLPEAIALIWLTPIAFWSGDIDRAAKRISMLTDAAQLVGLAPFVRASEGHKAILDIHVGRVDEGIDALQTTVARLRQLNSRMLEFIFSGYLADGYGRAERYKDALATIDQTLKLARLTGCAVYTPELLRRRAVFSSRLSGKVECLVDGLAPALEMARERHADTYELRILSDIVEAQTRQYGSTTRGRDELKSVYLRFSEGHDTPDITRVRSLLYRP